METTIRASAERSKPESRHASGCPPRSRPPEQILLYNRDSRAKRHQGRRKSKGNSSHLFTPYIVAPHRSNQGQMGVALVPHKAPSASPLTLSTQTCCGATSEELIKLLFTMLSCACVMCPQSTLKGVVSFSLTEITKTSTELQTLLSFLLLMIDAQTFFLKSACFPK